MPLLPSGFNGAWSARAVAQASRQWFTLANGLLPIMSRNLFPPSDCPGKCCFQIVDASLEAWARRSFASSASTARLSRRPSMSAVKERP
jgi:hypothetical protein